MTLLTWPNLDVQIKDVDINDLRVTYNEAKVNAAIWNKGGDISGFSIISPNACIYANVDSNITCQHRGYSGYVNCTSGVCGKAVANAASNENEFLLRFPNAKPSNFSINFSTTGFFGILPVSKDSKSYFCKLNEPAEKYFANYECIIS